MSSSFSQPTQGARTAEIEGELRARKCDEVSVAYLEDALASSRECVVESEGMGAVSYTHLTLPTKRIV